jgi:hypothetical protein
MAKRQEWEFEYTASDLAVGARKQLEFRRERVQWWQGKKEQVMATIRESGIEVNESLAVGSSNYASKALHGPQVMVRADLQQDISECHDKIQTHQRAADDYEAWVAMLDANPSQRVKCTQQDWQYFFGRCE